jgi:hypothetical protein
LIFPNDLPIAAQIKRASLRYRNPVDQPTKAEKEIIREYQKNLTTNQDLQPVVVDLNDAQMLYAKPILLDNPICLNCHGQEIEQISRETLQKIQNLYPEDQATGHELGDLRGIWSVTFQKEALQQYLDKQLNKKEG